VVTNSKVVNLSKCVFAPSFPSLLEESPANCTLLGFTLCFSVQKQKRERKTVNCQVDKQNCAGDFVSWICFNIRTHMPLHNNNNNAALPPPSDEHKENKTVERKTPM